MAIINKSLKDKIAKQFNKSFGLDYVFYDALCFGDDKTEVKAVYYGTDNPDNWGCKMFVFNSHKTNTGTLEIDTTNPIIRDYNPKQDW